MKTAKALICILLIAALTLGSVCALADGIKIGKANTSRTLVCSKSFSEMLGSLKKGARVLYWECGSENLVKVVTQKGLVGYCYRGYISEVKSVSKSDVMKTRHSATVYRLNSEDHMEKMCTISGGLPVILCATNGGWAKVKNLRGRVGYMKLEDLKKAF